MNGTGFARGGIVAILFAFGIWTLLASSSYDGDDDDALPPVPLSFVLAGLADELEIDTGERVVAFSALRLAGQFDVDRGDRLRLKSDFVVLDDTGKFSFSITPSDPADMLAGDAQLDIDEALDVGIDHSPADGRFSVVADGTTVVADANGSGVDVTVGTGNSVGYSWGDFEGLAEDEAVGVPARTAALAYLQIREVLRLTRIVELIQIKIDENDQGLESVGFDSPNEGLPQDCDNLDNGMARQYRLYWRRDADGTGQGSAGSGDDFEAILVNCLLPGQSRILKGDISIDEYLSTENADRKRLRFDNSLSEFFYGTEDVDDFSSPTRDLPRASGGFRLDYVADLTGP